MCSRPLWSVGFHLFTWRTQACNCRTQASNCRTQASSRNKCLCPIWISSRHKTSNEHKNKYTTYLWTKTSKYPSGMGDGRTSTTKCNPDSRSLSTAWSWSLNYIGTTSIRPWSRKRIMRPKRLICSIFFSVWHKIRVFQARESKYKYKPMAWFVIIIFS
jgi:hypothetical protein